MSPDLHDKTWMDCGISLSWDAEALNEICSPESVRSLREFMRLHEAQWPEDELKLINNRTLVVAGLEAAMDTLNPQNAVQWLEQTVYPAVRDFQDNVADGGGEAALIFWFADANRIWHRAADNTNADLGEGVVIAAPLEGFVKVFFPIGERQLPVAGLTSALSRSEIAVVNANGDQSKRTLRAWLCYQAHALPLMDNVSSLTSAKIDLLPHQVVLTHRVATASPRRFLIADEVGLVSCLRNS